MKTKICFSMFFLLAACETTNVYPTKMVAVQTVNKADASQMTATNTQPDHVDVTQPATGTVVDAPSCVTTTEPPAYLDNDCDGVDDDCDGQTDEDPVFDPNIAKSLIVWLRPDLDKDGFGDDTHSFNFCIDRGPINWITVGGDCSDNDATVHPGATEVCDTVDNNCNDKTDEDVSVPVFDDWDGDGYGSGNASGVLYWCKDQPVGPAHSTKNGDCNDNDAKIHPGADELCGDKIDNNCNKQVDEFPCVTYEPQVDPPSTVDADNDGIEAGVDCDDTDPSIGIEFAGCVDFKNSGEHKVVFVNKYIVAVVTGIDYKEVVDPADADAQLTNGTPYTGNAGAIEILLKGGSWLHFNIYAKMNYDYGYEFDSKQCMFKTLKLPPVYEFHDGKVKNRFPQIQVGKWDSGECYLTIPLAKIDP